MTTLGSYSFLPYVRRGVARLITAAESASVPAGQRASVQVQLTLTGSGIGNSPVTQPFAKAVELYGPGDIIGLDKRSIVRMEPRPSSMNAETPGLAHIEFYDEDFCWRYTPTSPDVQRDRLRPWITLVVLAEGEFKDGGTPPPKSLPYVDIQGSFAEVSAKFPPWDQLWAWAHVHVNGNLTANETQIVNSDDTDVASRLRSAIRENPDLAYCRLISPRKLAPKTTYHAFVMPSYEVGRLAGLGLPQGAAPSANHGAWQAYPSGVREKPNRFPYLHRWYFRSGGPGDFESLVRILEAKPVDSRVGTREVDLRFPGNYLVGLGPEPPLNGKLLLGGALKVPNGESVDGDRCQRKIPERWDEPYPHPLQSRLARLLNLADDYSRAVASTANSRAIPNDEQSVDPVITPPIYGQWHAGKTRLLTDASNNILPNNRNWFHEINLDPRYRIAAGLGTAIMVREQERFMEASWSQLGDVLEANRRIRLAQLAQHKALSLYSRQIKPLLEVDKARSLQLAAPLQMRMRIDDMTMRGVLLDSNLQPATLSLVTRRATRATARIKRFAPAIKHPQALFQGIGNGTIKTVAPRTTPQGIATLQKLNARRSGLSASAERASGLTADRLTAGALDALPKASGFSVLSIGDAVAPGGSSTTDSVEALRFKDALKDGYGMIDESFAQATPTIRKQLDVSTLAGRVIDALDPSKTIPARLRQRVSIPEALRVGAADNALAEVTTYPVIDEPLYKPLAAMSAELLLPRINLIPPNSVTLLESNKAFIDAVCVGANHEWVREAMWQEYPTNKRGSPLRKFWAIADDLSAAADCVEAPEELRDISPIGEWSIESKLGDHFPKVANPCREQKKEEIVLAIRGDLIRRYPSAVIMAHAAAWTGASTANGGPRGRMLAVLQGDEQDNPPRTKVRTPLFEAKVEPDIYFFGFDLTEAEVRGDENGANPGWYFVIQERPGEPRFGLDDGTGNELEVWNDLSWKQLQPGPPGSMITVGDNTPTLRVQSDALEADDANKQEQRKDDEAVSWHKDMSSADVAYILYQSPVRIAIHAAEMLKKLPPKCTES